MDQSQLQQVAFNMVKKKKNSETIMEDFWARGAFSTTEGMFTLY